MGENVVKLQPLPIDGPPNCMPNVGWVGVIKGEIATRVRCIKRDLLKISVGGCDSLECHDDPLGA
jgi:hypothetical protein